MSSKLAFDNKITKTINGKEYNFTLRNRCVFNCERELSKHNLMLVLNGVMTTEDLFIAFKWSAIGGGTLDLDDDAMFDLFLNAIAEWGYEGLIKTMVEIFAASGLLGDAKKAQAALAKA